MALGRQSKDMKSRTELAASQMREPLKKPAQAEKLAITRERESFEISRARVLEDLAKAENPRYRELLQRSLAFLDEKLAVLEGETSSLPYERILRKLVARSASATISLSKEPVSKLRVATDGDPRTTLEQFSTALSERAWLVDLAAIPPFVIEGTLDFRSEDELVDYAVQDHTLGCDVSSIVRLKGRRELVMLALYPSGAIRGLPGTIRPSQLGTMLTVDDLLATIDPNGGFEGLPPGGLSFSIRILAFDSKQ